MVRHRIILCSLFFVVLAACNGGKPAPARTEPQVSQASLLSASSAKSESLPGGHSNPAEFVGLIGAEAFVPDGAYSKVLADCVIVTAPQYSCVLSTLPFIGFEATSPSVDLIMSRVVVSHQWMGLRFEQALRKMPADLLLLFRSVTAIVIADDIRPSQFSTVTGAIYLDPELLWHNVEEKAIFRASASAETLSAAQLPLQFRSWSRYVKNNEPAYRVYSSLDDSERATEDIIVPLASLLFHELAHANDFFPPNAIESLSSSLSVYEAAGQMVGHRASDFLQAQSPLYAPELTHFAQVTYLRAGNYSETELEATADSFAEGFDLHAANDDYAFASKFEDVAMLFEEAMMRYHFGVDRDVGYVAVPKGTAARAPECNQFLLAWGMRNRGARVDIKPRMQLVVDRLLPGNQWPAFFASWAEPIELTPSQGWCESIRVPESAVPKFLHGPGSLPASDALVF